MAMGTLMRISEKLLDTSFWHTFEMKIPIDEADTVAMLSSTVCGSTCTFRMTLCDFFYFLCSISLF